jgi:hypothetical protein
VKVGGVVVTTLVQGSVVGRYETKMWENLVWSTLMGRKEPKDLKNWRSRCQWIVPVFTFKYSVLPNSKNTKFR